MPENDFEVYLSKLKKLISNPLKLTKWGISNLKNRNKMNFYLITLHQSGTHWVSWMISKYFVEFYDLNYRIDSTKVKKLVSEINSEFDKIEKQTPFFKHMHQPYLLLFYDKKVILLIRDLRDAIVSQYDKCRKTGKTNLEFSAFLENEILVSNKTSIYTTIKTRVDFLNSWHRNKKKPKDFLVVKYEDIKENPSRELKKVLNFIDFSTLEVDRKLVDKTVEAAKIDKMKEIDKDGGSINEGQTHRYKKYFTKEDMKKFNKYIENNLINSYDYSY